MANVLGQKSGYIEKKRDQNHLRWIILVLIGVALLAVYINLLKTLSGYGLLIVVVLFVTAIKFIDPIIDKAKQGERKATEGLLGEDEVGEVLSQLPDGYTVLHGLVIDGKWDIDFTIIGPTGVYTVEVKSHRGTIDYDGHQLTHDGHPFQEKDILKQACGQAWSIHQNLLDKLQRSVFVTPIIVFSNKYTSVRFGQKMVNNTYVIRKDWLNDVITKRSNTVGQDTQELVEVLQTLLPK